MKQGREKPVGAQAVNAAGAASRRGDDPPEVATVPKVEAAATTIRKALTSTTRRAKAGVRVAWATEVEEDAALVPGGDRAVENVRTNLCKCLIVLSHVNIDMQPGRE